MRKPLDKLHEIHASEDVKQKTISYILERKQKKFISFKKSALVSACISTICLFMVFSFLLIKPSQDNKSSSPIAFVSMDINPSIEFAIDKNYKIVEVTTYNEDAKKITKQVALDGLVLEEAIDELLKNPEYATYLLDGILEIGVTSTNQTVAKDLEKRISSCINKASKPIQYHCSNIDQATYDESKQHHMSSGKYALIEQILKLDISQDINSLRNLNMQQLYDILYSLNPDEAINNNGMHKGNRNGNGNQHRNHNHGGN